MRDRTRSARRARTALAAAVLLAALAWLASVASTGRTRPPAERREAALAAFERASAAGAGRWAPSALRAADEALREGLTAWSREEARFGLRRDFRPAEAALTRAEELSALALDRTRIARETARLSAAEAVENARGVEQQALDLFAVTSLPHAQRARLQTARLLVQEAEKLMAGGEIDAAAARAHEAMRELREALGPPLEAALRYTSKDEVASWRRWVEETQAWSRSTGRTAIVVLKEKNELVLLVRGVAARRYAAEVGANAIGTKQREGDRATPEGLYRVVAKKDRGRSRYHRALLLDYPNAADRARFAAAKRRGDVPEGAGIGGLIEIHGEGGRGRNWTDGCVALANRDMDDLYARVGIGTRVTIVGGDGKDGAFSGLLARAANGGEAKR